MMRRQVPSRAPRVPRGHRTHCWGRASANQPRGQARGGIAVFFRGTAKDEEEAFHASRRRSYV